MSENKKKAVRRSGFRTNRKLQLGATATVLTVVVIAAVMVFNVIVGILYDRFPWALDLTADSTYTLSDESREVAKKVNQDLEILVFMDEAMFASPTTESEDANVILRQFYRFTQDYGTLSGGKVTTKYLDMEADPTLATKYKEYEVDSSSILFRTKDQYRVISIDDLYKEELDSTTYSYVYSSLVEQKLASTVNAVCGGKTVTLTFLTGHGENEQVIASMKSLYELNGYTTNVLNLGSATEIDETTEAMIIVGPTSDYSIEEITRLRAWLSNDGKLNRDLLVMCNYLGSCPNLYDFLKNDYGVTVTDNLVVETNTDNYLQMMGEMIPITSIEGSDVTPDLDGEKVMMPYTLELKTAFGTDTEAEAVTNHPLVEFPESAKLIAQSQLTENTEADPKDAEEYPVIGMVYAKEMRQTSEHAGVTNVIVSGSYLYPITSSMTQYKNEALTLEPIRTIASLGDTVVISAKDLSSITLSYSVSDARAIQIVMIAVPLILVAISLFVFLRRRHL